ncbi:MAG: aldo/keto reductase [Clostridia bacterium]|nr:aldo/keto reductase [Clostridia bacterium]
MHKKLGFGLMRLPMKDGEVDIPQTCRMVDRFLEEGFNYFDTAHGYIQGKSEKAVKAALSSRYPRESYILTNKLSGGFWSRQEDIEPLLNSQLEACGVAYFDYYLMHALDKTSYRRYLENGAFSEVLRLKEKGKVRHMGISFHDTAEVLDMILTEQPEIEIVQIQFNYRDYEDPDVQSGKCLEVCRKHGKPVLVMEPVRGGSLVDLPEAAQQLLSARRGGSLASYALRYCASFEGIVMILSGMSSTEQMEDNIVTMKEDNPLTEDEMKAIGQVVEILRNQNQIPCTRCEYCTERCPKNIPIPQLFKAVNRKREFRNADITWSLNNAVKERGKPSDCISCGLCERVCPQHIEIRSLLREIAENYQL